MNGKSKKVISPQKKKRNNLSTFCKAEKEMKARKTLFFSLSFAIKLKVKKYNLPEFLSFTQRKKRKKKHTKRNA